MIATDLDALDRYITMPFATPERSRTLLLVEDGADDERLALRAFQRCGVPIQVRVARDGEQALQALGLDDPRTVSGPWIPDLVVSDLKIPRVRGDEVLGRVRSDEALRDVPYVVFTSSDEPQDAQRCLALGAFEYAVKPIGYEEYMTCAQSIARRWLGAN